MKQIVKGLIVVGAMVAAGGASAAMEDISPMVGVDAEWIHMKGKGNLNRILPKSYWGGNVWIGARFCENVGLEAGYNWTNNRKKSHIVKAGETATFSAPVGTKVTGKAKFSGWHVDLLGYLPMDECFDLIGTVGYGWDKPKLHIHQNTTPAVNFNRKGKNKGVFRAGVGGQYMVSDNVGLRVMGRYQNTSQLRLKTTNRTKVFKDAFSLSVGAFVKF